MNFIGAILKWIVELFVGFARKTAHDTDSAKDTDPAPLHYRRNFANRLRDALDRGHKDDTDSTDSVDSRPGEPGGDDSK
jgi:hypothetical protein